MRVDEARPVVVTLLARQSGRRVSLIGAGRRIGAATEQKLDEIEVAVVRGLVERRVPVARVGNARRLASFLVFWETVFRNLFSEFWIYNLFLKSSVYENQ